MTNSDISGQITDGSGNPIGSAEVYLWREDLAGAGGVVASTTADSSGNFSFTAHPDGSGSSESWHIAAKDPNANVQLRSAYGVTASPPTSVNSQFNVSITGTSPSPVSPGDTLTVGASLTNRGTDSDTQTITLDIDNGVGQVDSSLEAAQGGASDTTTLSWAVPSGQTAQDYQATVASADDTASQTVTVNTPPPASLVSHWTLDTADTNSGTAVDVVGSNDGTISGATTGVSGANQTYTTNEAYDFDGVDDYVALGQTPDIFNASGSFSLAAWVACDSKTGGGNVVYDGASQVDVRLFSSDFFGNVGDVPGFTIKGSSDQFALGSSSIVGTGFRHLVGTYDASNGMTFYLDGTQEGSNNFTGPFNARSKQDHIGGTPYFGSDNLHDGKIDDVRIYDKELTSTEVSNLYNNGRI